MLRAPVKAGQKVQIEVQTGIKKIIVDCYIIETDSDRLTLSFPESKREFAPYLSEGTEIKAFVYSFTGIMIVNSIVYDAPFDGRLTIEFNYDSQVIQRRKYVRMPYITDFIFELAETNLRTNTVDISGGGVRFLTDNYLKPESEYKANLRLEQYEPLIKVKGRILKKNFYKSNEYVMEFSAISEDDRNKIINKCLKIEREQ